MGRAELAPLNIEWCCSPEVGAPLQRLHLSLPAGSCVADALQAAGYDKLPEGWALAVWGKRVPAALKLQDGDRVELLRPLSADPMEARRRRHALEGMPRHSRHRPGSGSR